MSGPCSILSGNGSFVNPSQISFSFRLTVIACANRIEPSTLWHWSSACSGSMYESPLRWPIATPSGFAPFLRCSYSVSLMCYSSVNSFTNRL